MTPDLVCADLAKRSPDRTRRHSLRCYAKAPCPSNPSHGKKKPPTRTWSRGLRRACGPA